jgi:hypothetical protein
MPFFSSPKDMFEYRAAAANKLAESYHAKSEQAHRYQAQYEMFLGEVETASPDAWPSKKERLTQKIKSRSRMSV